MRVSLDLFLALRSDTNFQVSSAYDLCMNKSRQSGSEDLKSIARRVMYERGLLPEFSAAALKQAELITAAASTAGSDIRDLRALLWASIDNDDSRDLDQLSVAEPLANGRVRILIAIADVDA
ncbi:MAG: RNB domain-containing ribonuclease, partial [Steroidobacteraceae bacterium]